MILKDVNNTEVKEMHEFDIKASALPMNIDINTTKMSDKEAAIYNGLKSFRPEIAIYYKDGLLLKNSSIQSKSNLLAHLLREIDGGLRAVFEDSEKKEDDSNYIALCWIDIFYISLLMRRAKMSFVYAD